MFNPQPKADPSLTSTPVALPDSTHLTAILNSIWAGTGERGLPVEVIHREGQVPTGHFPSEIVTCQFRDGSRWHVLCKYGTADMDSAHWAHGHRGGLPFEALVYRNVLEPLRVSVPRYWGEYRDPRTGLVALVLEYLEQGVRLDVTTDLTAVSLAAQWIGQFHAATTLDHGIRPAFLSAYDADYYQHWQRGTLRLAHELRREFPWLTAVADQFEEFIHSLLTAPATVIHGEYYPGNVLVAGGITYPIDWESAAIAPGEIDLASLTDGWSEEIVRQCEQAYERSRWPAGSPPEFNRTLDAARLYLHFRWLGAIGEELALEHETERFNRLRTLSEHLGLLG